MTAVIFGARKPGVAERSAGSSVAVTDPTVGAAGAEPTRMLIALYLSLRVTTLPRVTRAQPSGIESE